MTVAENRSRLSAIEPAMEKGWLVGLNHISVHVRDLDEATRFWIELFGGEPRGEAPGRKLFHVEVAGVMLAFFESPGHVGWDLEYPHYAFTVTPAGMRGLKRRLDAAGVKTHDPWTRNRREALMYFRDPTGNLFELYCPQYDAVDQLRLGAGKGGDFRPPVADLRYEWIG